MVEVYKAPFRNGEYKDKYGESWFELYSLATFFKHIF